MLRLAVALQAQGVRVTVLAPSAAGLESEAVIDGVTVRRYRYAPHHWETLAYTGTMASQASGPKGLALLAGLVAAGAFALRRAVAHDAPNVVHAHWWFPGGLSAIGGVGKTPLVTTLHGSDVRLAKGHSVAVGLMRRVLRRSTHVTAVSEFLAREIGAIALGQQVQVAPMPIDLSVFTPVSATAEKERFLFVGRLNAQKGVSDVLRALARCEPTAQLDIVGEGEDSVTLHTLATTLGVERRVTWHGMLAQCDLPALYRRATALVVPSDQEGLGLVAVEAACCGTPTIAYDGGGITDVVSSPSAGWLVPPGDVSALTEAMREAGANPTERNRRGAAARESMLTRFDPAVAAARYLDIYRQAIDHA